MLLQVRRKLSRNEVIQEIFLFKVAIMDPNTTTLPNLLMWGTQRGEPECGRVYLGMMVVQSLHKGWRYPLHRLKHSALCTKRFHLIQHKFLLLV